MTAKHCRKVSDTLFIFAVLCMIVPLWWDEGAPALLTAAWMCLGGSFVLARRARRSSRGDDQ